MRRCAWAADIAAPDSATANAAAARNLGMLMIASA
jgi:hypothetical protein